MPNPIKYSTGSESDALKKGNLYIGTGTVGKGPSDTTGYYNGVSPISGGYTIYMYKSGEPGDLSYHSAANDSELISFTNNLAGQSYTGVQQCFNYYYGQTDKVLVNQDYPADFPYIVMDGLVLYLDAGISLSYSGSGISWYDVNGLGPKNNASLYNGPTYNSDNGGSIFFDGTNDYGQLSKNILNGTDYTGITFCAWVNRSSSISQALIAGVWNQTANGDQAALFIFNNGVLIAVSDGIVGESGSGVFGNLTLNQWTHIAGTWQNDRTYKVYINGSLAGTGSQSGNGWNGSSIANFEIGAENQANFRYFNGKIANTLTYNRTLSGTEILQNYNAQKGRFGL